MSGAPGTTPGEWVTQRWSPKELAVVTHGEDGKPCLITGYALPADANQIAASKNLFDVVSMFMKIFDPAALVESDLADSRYADVARAAYVAMAKARGEPLV